MVKKLVKSKNKLEETMLLKKINKEVNPNVSPEPFSLEKTIAWRLSLSRNY